MSSIAHRLSRLVRNRSVIGRIAAQYDSLRYLTDRRLALLAAANVLDSASVSLIAPLLPLYAERLGASYLLIGVMFAAETLAKAVLSAPFGHLADSVDRRPLIVLGTLASGLSVVGLGLVGSPLAFVALRLVDGAAGAMRGPATSAYIGDQFPAAERGRALGANRTMGMLGLALGPAIGGLLAAGTSLAVPFVVLGGVTILGGLALRRLPTGASTSAESEDEDDVSPALWRSRSILANPTVLALATTSAMAGFSAGAFSPLFPLLLTETFDAGPAYMGAAWSAFGLSMFVFTPVGGTLADRIGRKPGMVGGRLAWAVLYAGLVLAVAPVVPPALLLLGGVASAVAGPAQGALNYESAPPGFEGTLVGFYGSLASAGAAVGPVAAGWAAGRVGIRAAFLALAALAAVDAAIVALGVRESGP